MPNSIPSSFVSVKNSLGENQPVVLLLDIFFQGATVRLANNTDDVLHLGNTYSKFQFSIDNINEAKNEVPAIGISVDNTARVVQNYIEQFNGGVGANVKLKLVHLASPDDIILEYDFVLNGVNCTSQYVNFVLGSVDIWRKRAPQRRMRKNFCQWRFKDSNTCKYSGAETTCNKTITRCRQLNNSFQYGGFLGVGGGGLTI